MPHMVDLTQTFTDTLKLKSAPSSTQHDQLVYSMTTDRTPDPTNPVGLKTIRRKRKRPTPIDINLAHQNRAQQALPRIKSPISSPLEDDPSTPRESSSVTPLYVYIYAQLRSPGSSTPFPIKPDTPEKAAMPVTAIFEPPAVDTPLTATWNSPSRSAGAVPRQCSNSTTPVKPLVAQTESTKYSLSESKRLRYILSRLVNPIDTEVETFTTSPTWYRARTPIAGRWDLFRRPSQVRLARLAERAWYREEKSDVYDDDDSEDESDVDSGMNGSSSGWSGLPSPISPLFV